MSNGQLAPWRPTTFGALAKRLVNGGTPPTSISEYWNGTIPWITGADFTPSGLSAFRRHVSVEAVAYTATNVINKGELLLVTRTGVGKLALAPCDVAISQDITGAYVDKVQVDTSFLLHRMRQGVEDLKKLNQGTSINGIVRKDLVDYKILLPPLRQQERIAEILTTLDEAIEQTDALIAKAYQIRAGLVRDLFTRGVAPDGRLRPTRHEAPNLYWKSPLGWIPKSWEAAPCSDLTDMITVGIVVRPAQYYVAAGVPAFRSANIREDGIDPADLVYISAHANSQLTKSQVREGDVLSVRTGYPGTSAVVPREYQGANCIDILISRPRPRLRSAYLAAWINSSFGKEQVLRKQGGLAQQHFNVGELRELLVALPAEPEQDRIIARLEASDNELAEERRMSAKYTAMKAGLMHDLLFGRVLIPDVEVARGADV